MKERSVVVVGTATVNLKVEESVCVNINVYESCMCTIISR